MILYHITRDMDHNGYFYPEIPEAILVGENEEIPRVCTSKTIEGCLGSMPGGGKRLEETMDDYGDIFKVFKIDTKKLKIRHVLESQELTEDKLVFDANLSDECWILDDFQVPNEDIFFIKVENYSLEVQGYDNYEYYEKMEELGMSDEEFYDSEEYDQILHMDEFGMIYDLTYRIIKGMDLEYEIDLMNEEFDIAYC